MFPVGWVSGSKVCREAQPGPLPRRRRTPGSKPALIIRQARSRHAMGRPRCRESGARAQSADEDYLDEMDRVLGPCLPGNVWVGTVLRGIHATVVDYRRDLLTHKLYYRLDYAYKGTVYVMDETFAELLMLSNC